jgi:DNA-binding transcriptional LysR family regulator
VRRLEWDEQEEFILSGRVDVANVRQPITERGLRLVALFAELRLAALPADHPLAQRTSVSIADSQWSTRSDRANAKRTQKEKRPQSPIRVNPPRCSAWTVSGTPAPACTRSVSTTASLGVPKT